jgi:hypothetical protein
MLKIIAFAILALISLSNTSAGPFAPAQNPDNWSDAPQHFLIVGLVPGLIVGSVWPDLHPAAQFGMCSVPGLFHEFEPSSGNTWSRRDLLVNSLGCGVGLWATHGFRIGATPGGVQLTYSVRIQ